MKNTSRVTCTRNVCAAILTAFLLSGCADTSFTTSTDMATPTKVETPKEQKAKKKTIDPVTEVDVEASENIESDADLGDNSPSSAFDLDAAYETLVTEDSNFVICYRDGPKDYHFNSGSVYSASSHSSPEAKHVVFSPIMTFELSNFSGNVLPLANYRQDDVVMIVPADTTEDMLISWDGRLKTIQVPADTIFVRDANSTRFASGKVDDKGNMLYRFANGVSISLPGGKSKTLSDLYDLATMQTPSDDIRLSRLAKDSYFDRDSRSVSFRFALIPHGVGFAIYDLKIPSC